MENLIQNAKTDIETVIILSFSLNKNITIVFRKKWCHFCAYIGANFSMLKLSLTEWDWEFDCLSNKTAEETFHAVYIYFPLSHIECGYRCGTLML